MELTVKCKHCTSYAYFKFGADTATCPGGHVIDRKGELIPSRERDDLDEMMAEVMADPISRAAYEAALLSEATESDV
jgi:hypothetical protein